MKGSGAPEPRTLHPTWNSRPMGPYLSIAAVLASAALLQVANGILIALMPLRMTAEALPATSVGLVSTGYALGFLVGCLTVATLVRRVGHIRTFAAMASLMAASALLFTIDTNTVLWALLRAMMGFCMAGLATVSDSWVSGQTAVAVRGRVLSFYMVSNKLAMATGPLILGLSDISGPEFFMIVSGLLSLSLVPLALTRRASPTAPSAVRLDIRGLYRLAPSSVIGCFAIGLINSAVINLSPVFGAQLGLAAVATAALISALQIGSLLMQWPLGWLSDSMDRRRVIAVAASAVAALSLPLALPLALPETALFLLFALWGGVGLSIYAVCVAHATDVLNDPSRLIPTTSGLLLVWAVGSAVGPLVGSIVMQLIGANGLFAYAGVCALAFAGFVGYRIRRQIRPPDAERERFVNMPASSPVIPQMDPRGQA